MLDAATHQLPYNWRQPQHNTPCQGKLVSDLAYTRRACKCLVQTPMQPDFDCFCNPVLGRTHVAVLVNCGDKMSP